MPLPALLLAVACPPQDVVLPETVVTAPRSEATITTNEAERTVVTAAELAETGEASLPRAIGKASGVWIQESELGGGTPIVRGLLGNKVLILVDGVRLNDSTTRFGPRSILSTVDVAIVERVEITRGPASLLYGSDAVGGVVAIWTKRVRPLGEEAEAKVGGFAETELDSRLDGGRAALGVRGATAEDGWNFVLSGSSLDDLETARGEVPFTGFDSFGAFGSWVHALGPDRALSLVARIKRDLDVPRTDKLVTGFGQVQPTHERFLFTRRDRRGYVATYDDRRGGPLADEMQARLSLSTYVEEREERKTGSATTSFERDDVTTLGLGVDWRRALGDAHLLSWGLDATSDDVDSTRADVDGGGGTTEKDGEFAPGSRYTSLGVFVQDEVFALDPWFLTAGVRYSFFDFAFDGFGGGPRESGTFDALTAGLEAARELDGGVRLVASLSQGFRAPNLEDLASAGTFAGGEELPNADLDPERSLTAELALEATRPRWSAAVAVFGTRIEDLVGRALVTPGPPGDEVFRRENVGRLDLVGAEALGRRRLSSSWSLEGALAFVRGRESEGLGGGDVEGRRIPPLNGRLGLAWDAADPGARLGFGALELTWAARQDQLHPQDASDPRIDPNGTPGWAVIDVRLGGTLGPGRGTSWHLGLENLLDAAYRRHGSGVDGPGRGLVLGLSVSF